MNDLEGKVVIVTGASSGLGEATAVNFSNAGAKVVVAARRGFGGGLPKQGSDRPAPGSVRRRSNVWWPIRRSPSPGWTSRKMERRSIGYGVRSQC